MDSGAASSSRPPADYKFGGLLAEGPRSLRSGALERSEPHPPPQKSWGVGVGFAGGPPSKAERSTRYRGPTRGSSRHTLAVPLSCRACLFFGALRHAISQDAAAKDAAEKAAFSRPKLPPEDRSRVIFLDVDGVLLPSGSVDTIVVDGVALPTRDHVRESDFAISALGNLRSIVQQTGASIVLSSEWRTRCGPCPLPPSDCAEEPRHPAFPRGDADLQAAGGDSGKESDLCLVRTKSTRDRSLAERQPGADTATRTTVQSRCRSTIRPIRQHADAYDYILAVSSTRSVRRDMGDWVQPIMYCRWTNCCRADGRSCTTELGCAIHTAYVSVV
ncbi:unnamed protein product [Prorocentrum cordatum]|uniref:Uncharacterized protein n=1 Tax=Prorocentrum cordatum TaxID=2364126 RepID=A0ABN9TX52_9DINO|nr:unnamed protein product [Polarella glacialis]